MPEPEAQNQGEAVAQITDLLAGKVETPTETPPGDGDIAPTDGQPAADPQADSGDSDPELTPKSLAEQLGISTKQLFAQLKIPVDGGDAMTLGEFKDNGAALRGLNEAQNELAESKVNHENSVMHQRQMLQSAVARIPAEYITPEIVGELQAEYQQYVGLERNALHQVRPDLADAAKWNETRNLLVEHLRPYGFRAIEIDSIIDHRLAKYVIDNAERDKRVRQLNADGIQVADSAKLSKPSQQPAASSKRAASKTAVKRGKAVGSNQDKAAQVAKLLGTQ